MKIMASTFKLDIFRYIFPGIEEPSILALFGLGGLNEKVVEVFLQTKLDFKKIKFYRSPIVKENNLQILSIII